jgi:hypothetical protein
MKLYLILLGALPPGRNVEQHDYFFGIAENLADLLPAMKAFWPDAGKTLHIDGWREVTKVDAYTISVLPESEDASASSNKLFFLNLGGYTTGKLEEQHYTVLTVQQNKLQAAQAAKQSVFFKTNSLKGIAASHIDEKYGVDVDEVYQIEDILSENLKEKYRIVIKDTEADLPEDAIHLGYIKLDKLAR